MQNLSDPTADILQADIIPDRHRALFTVKVSGISERGKGETLEASLYDLRRRIHQLIKEIGYAGVKGGWIRYANEMPVFGNRISLNRTLQQLKESGE